MGCLDRIRTIKFSTILRFDALCGYFFGCLLSSNAHVRREIAHAARILTCIDKRNGKYNQNQDPPSVSLLKVLLSKIYAEKKILLDQMIRSNTSSTITSMSYVHLFWPMS